MTMKFNELIVFSYVTDNNTGMHLVRTPYHDLNNQLLRYSPPAPIFSRTAFAT